MIERPPDTRDDMLWDAVDELRGAVVSPGSSEAQVCLAQAHAARAHGLALVDVGISLRRIANAIDGQAGTTWMPGRVEEISGDGSAGALPLVTRADVDAMVGEAREVAGHHDVIKDALQRRARDAYGHEIVVEADPRGELILLPAATPDDLPEAVEASEGVRTLRYRRV